MVENQYTFILPYNNEDVTENVMSLFSNTDKYLLQEKVAELLHCCAMCAVARVSPTLSQEGQTSHQSPEGDTTSVPSCEVCSVFVFIQYFTLLGEC